MKKIALRRGIVLLLAIGLLSCGGKKSDSEHKSSWPEMNNFHKVMADVYHPYMDSGNLAPIRARSVELASVAAAWAGSAVPEGTADAVKPGLEKLKADAAALDEAIKGGASDADIGKQLSALHESFHSIMEAAHGAHKEHNEK